LPDRSLFDRHQASVRKIGYFPARFQSLNLQAGNHTNERLIHGGIHRKTRRKYFLEHPASLAKLTTVYLAKSSKNPN